MIGLRAIEIGCGKKGIGNDPASAAPALAAMEAAVRAIVRTRRAVRAEKDIVDPFFRGARNGPPCSLVAAGSETVQ
jgi:hypothetical protein